MTDPSSPREGGEPAGRADESAPDPAGDAARRGPDMARAALEAARARNAAARAGSRTGRQGTTSEKASGAPAGAAARRLRRRRWSGPGVDRARDPQRLGETVTTWLSATGAGREVVKATVFTRWAELVGPDIAAHATPVSLVDGELLVQAESTAWATQLRLLSAGMIRKINAEIGRGTVTRIRTAGPAGPSWRFGNRHVPGRGPRDTYG